MGLSPITDQTVEPVTVAMVKAHTKVEHHADNALLAVYLSAARAYGENYTRRQFVQETFELAMSDSSATSSGKIELGPSPLPSPCRPLVDFPLSPIYIRLNEESGK